TTTAFVVGTAGLVGLLPLGGFWALRLGMDDFWTERPLLVIVLLLVNCLSAVNLTRVFRLVFLGKTQPKTRRAPEVPWQMAVPMVSLSIVTLLVPVMMQRLSILPDWEYLNQTALLVLCFSGLVGIVLGGIIDLPRNWSRSTKSPLRFVQDLLAYDFYMERIYRLSVVFAVSQISRLNNAIDRYVIDGFVNFVGLATIFSGESLKYSISGKSQFYVLTILVGVSFFGFLMIWLFDQATFREILERVLVAVNG
ncbi:MAG TPA: NAD(P)H-quinone oxidoreductase subunit F, partial [Phormidium sp.]